MRRGPLLGASYRTPFGSLIVVVDPHALGDRGPTTYGAVVAATFSNLDHAISMLGVDAHQVHPRSPVDAVRAALDAYVSGDLDALMSVSVLQPGGPFQQRAWIAMREIPVGSTITYADLARRAESPAAVRAAGNACAVNRVAPFVPCHRVLASDGSLGGYAYGLDTKIALLEHEGVLL